MDDNLRFILSELVLVVTALLASSGFWVYMLKRFERNDDTKKLLLGLAHDRIGYLAMKYIERGYITREEYSNLYTFLYCPYRAMGGNGVLVRVMEEIDKLEIKDYPRYQRSNQKKEEENYEISFE